MSFLVLTGTTGFPLLESHILALARNNPEMNFVLQSPNSLSGTPNVECVRFLGMDDLDASRFRAVIGHCGAGTVFWALERSLPLIAVVDLVRPDNHQDDLGAWIRNNNYGMVLRNRGPTTGELLAVTQARFQTYERTPFSVKGVLKLLS